MDGEGVVSAVILELFITEAIILLLLLLSIINSNRISATLLWNPFLKNEKIVDTILI
jgi:hypothetical protein